MLNKIVNGDVALWVLLVLLVAPPRIGERHYLFPPSRVLHHGAYILGKVRLVVELHNLRPVALAIAAEEAYQLVFTTLLAELFEVKNVMVLLVWVFENQTDKGTLIVADHQSVQPRQDIDRLDLVCTFVESVSKVRFASFSEADAQVEASCAIVPLLLDCLVLTSGKWNHKPSIPMCRAQKCHRVMCADYWRSLFLFHFLQSIFNSKVIPLAEQPTDAPAL